MDHQGVEFVPLPWVTLHWAVGVLLYKGQLQDNRSHCLIQGFFQGKDISAIIIRRTAYKLGQVTNVYALVEERRMYKTLINSYVRPWSSRSSPIARGGRQRETTSTFALPMSTMTRQQCLCHHEPALRQKTHHQPSLK